MSREHATQQAPQDLKEEADPELSIPKTSVPNYQTTATRQNSAKANEIKRTYRGQKVGEFIESITT